MLENKFKTKLVKELESMFPGCIITHLDPNEIQGIPDLLILYKNGRHLKVKRVLTKVKDLINHIMLI